MVQLPKMVLLIKNTPTAYNDLVNQLRQNNQLKWSTNKK